MIVTQQDIAEKLGVTRVLVSRALSDHPSVAAATRERIVKTAAAMGYSVNTNQAAKTLIAKRYKKPLKTGILAVTMPAAFDGQPLKEVPFFMPFFNGIGREAKARGLEVCLCPVGDDVPRVISSRSVDGVLSVGDVSLVQELRNLEMPVVVVDYYCDDVPHLVPADRDGMRQATEHLISLGHERIAYIGHPIDVGSSHERFAGFRSALYDRNLPLDEGLWINDLLHGEAEHGEAAVSQLLRSGAKFTAVVCYHDVFAIGAARALVAAGLRVPEDVSVVGFDDVSTLYGANPPITSVAFDREAMGRRAVQMFCEGEVNAATQEVFPVQLMVRGSTRKAKRPGV